MCKKPTSQAFDDEDVKTAKSVQKFLANRSGNSEAKEKTYPSILGNERLSPDVKNALQAILSMTSPKVDETRSIKVERLVVEYRTLLSEGFPETVGLLLERNRTTLSELEFDDLDLIASTEASIGTWIGLKFADDREKKKAIVNELRTIATKEPERALASALAIWCCKNTDVNQLRKLVPLVAVDIANDSRRRLLELVGLRDKDGDFMTNLLRAKTEFLQVIAQKIRANPRLLRHAIESVPRWFRHPSADVLPALFTEVIGDYAQTSGQRRGDVSGLILRLAGALVPILDKSKAAENLANMLQAQALEVLQNSEDSEERHRTWAPIQSGNQSLGGSNASGLSPDQAKQLGLAVIRARKGKDALTELESAYVNLGGTRFGEVGETVSYDATIHNDMAGGILPGDIVEIVRSGLQFGEAGVVKADVKLGQPS